MKSIEDVMEILEAYDLTQSSEAAALCGCDAKTVARYVALRNQGVRADVVAARDSVIDPYLDKIEEWVERSRGDIRADVVHRKLIAMDYPGSEHTTRRVVALAKAAYAREGTAASSVRGYRSLGCGSSGTGARDRAFGGERRTCGARGWRGRAIA